MPSTYLSSRRLQLPFSFTPIHTRSFLFSLQHQQLTLLFLSPSSCLWLYFIILLKLQPYNIMVITEPGHEFTTYKGAAVPKMSY